VTSHAPCCIHHLCCRCSSPSSPHAFGLPLFEALGPSHCRASLQCRSPSDMTLVGKSHLSVICAVCCRLGGATAPTAWSTAKSGEDISRCLDAEQWQLEFVDSCRPGSMGTDSLAWALTAWHWRMCSPSSTPQPHWGRSHWGHFAWCSTVSPVVLTPAACFVAQICLDRGQDFTASLVAAQFAPSALPSTNLCR